MRARASLQRAAPRESLCSDRLRALSVSPCCVSVASSASCSGLGLGLGFGLGLGLGLGFGLGLGLGLTCLFKISPSAVRAASASCRLARVLAISVSLARASSRACCSSLSTSLRPAAPRVSSLRRAWLGLGLS